MINCFGPKVVLSRTQATFEWKWISYFFFIPIHTCFSDHILLVDISYICTLISIVDYCRIEFYFSSTKSLLTYKWNSSENPFFHLPSMKNEHLIQILCRCTFHSNFQYMKIAFKYCKMYFLKRKYEENIRRKTRSWTSVLEHTRYVLADEALWWFLIYVNILFSVCKGSQYNTTDIHSLSFNWNDSSCQRGKRDHTSEIK